MTKAKCVSLGELSVTAMEQMVLVPSTYDLKSGSKGTIIKSAGDIKQGGVMNANEDRIIMQVP